MDTKGQEIYDVVIIGSGPGGYVAAIRARQLGLKTAIVEKDAKFGGTCLHRGCIPTKSLLHSAHLYRQATDAKDFGVECGNVKLNFANVHSIKERTVKKLSIGIEHLLRKNGVQTFAGYGKIVSPNAVEVTRDGAKAEKISTRNIIIATGSEPRSLPGILPDGKGIITSNEALTLAKPPKSMLIIGAGAIGIEFASMYNDFGTAVTVVEILPNILPLEDEEVSKELGKILAKRKIAIFTGAKVESVAAGKGECKAALSIGGKKETRSFEKILVAVGRKPNTGAIGLEKTKAKVTRDFVEVNEYMQTAEPSIYAIGDAVATPQLAHVASAEGILAVEKIKGVATHGINYDHVPSCTYSSPQVASVGLSEKKARERGHKVKIGRFPFAASGKASILRQNDGFVKVVADERYGELLGVHIVGEYATEMIAEAAAALAGEMCAEDLAKTIHAHPTLSESLMEAAHAVGGAAIHA